MTLKLNCVAATLTGQVPELEFDGKVLSESLAIARFLAKEFNLYGETNWDQAQADMVVDCLMDVAMFLGKVWYEKDPEKSAQLKKEFEEEHFPKGMSLIETFLKKNGGKYFAGNQVTLYTTFHRQKCIVLICHGTNHFSGLVC